MIRELSLKEIHTELLKMLSVIDSMCERNNLCYMLSGGSLLGAIRHKGFIPWDDDVDIMMPREDYEKFIEIFHNNETYNLFTLENKKWDFPYIRMNKKDTFADNGITKVENGLYIDIFPIEMISNNDRVNTFRMKYLKTLNVLRNAARREKFGVGEKNILIKRLISPIAKSIGAHKLSLLMNGCAYKTNEKYKFSTRSGVILSTKYGKSEFFK